LIDISVTEAVAPEGELVKPEEACRRCGKPLSLCVCAGIQPIDNKIALLILQHPQEQDKALGTARLTALHFRKAVFKTGLSWPSLSKALGRTADPAKWATLYLGAADPLTLAPGQELVALDAKGNLLPRQQTALADLQGIIVLDGSWSQAKTLWWRNAWLLKSRRVVLAPRQPSLYGKLRREPRREGLSTLESVALLLARLENRPEIETALTGTFAALLARYRALPPGSAAAGPPPVKPDHRRRPMRRQPRA
jgi:DTW domain-containing protein YfiP